MTVAVNTQLSELLEQVARSLDIPDGKHEEAVRKYDEVGHWLEENDKKEGRREPSVYPQGSFRLGTVVHPISDKDDYDIDLVYERDLRKGSTSQKQLKEEAGEYLESFVEYMRNSHREAPKLESGRRCWTLTYSDGFHMDILPAIPDDERRAMGSVQNQTAIEITDEGLHEWQVSNPIAYAEWFKGQMRQQFIEKRATMARELLEAKGMAFNELTVKEAAEQVPDFKVKTPLQRAIQILKRHRDLHFANDKDNRASSIILTTLAAKAYMNEGDLVDALINLVREMPNHIEYRVKNGKRVSWVPNPVNPEENFADRWHDEDRPHREERFRGWLRKVNEDLTMALKGGGIHKVVDLLGLALGPTLVKKAAAAIGHQMLQERRTGNLKMDSASGLLGSTGDIKVKEHTFYGVDESKEG